MEDFINSLSTFIYEGNENPIKQQRSVEVTIDCKPFKFIQSRWFISGLNEKLGYLYL